MLGKRIAIIGSSGYIAGYLRSIASVIDSAINIISVDCTGNCDYFLDLRNPQQFQYDILSHIQYIVFTAAISGPDKCADEFGNCWKINVVGTEYFIRQALKYGCRVIFFSSDAVFGETNNQIAYEHSSTVNALPYGKMKKRVEDTFRNDKNFKAIRLSYVVSAKDRFISYCLNCIHEGKKAEIYHPFYRNCISVHDVVEVVYWLIFHWDDLPCTFLNVAGTELVSRLQMADELNCLMDGKLEYCVANPEVEFYMNRAKITHMSSLYLYEKKIIRRRSFFELLQEELKGVQL